MGIYGALQTAVSGLKAQSHAMENISGNIANSQTTGYKRIETSFIDLIPDSPVKSQVPGAVNSYSRSTNGDRGDIQNAATETYMALNGSGFFVVEPATGDTSGTFYTRRGDFDMDKSGFLVNGAGYKLKGVAMVDGVVVGSVPEAIKVDMGFLPAKRSTSIDYQLNLPQLPKNGAYTAASQAPGSELFKPWNYANATPTPHTVTATVGSALPAVVPANTLGASADGSAAASGVVSNGDTLTIDVGGTNVTYVFDTDGTNTPLAGQTEIDASGDIASVLALIQADARTVMTDPALTVGIKGGKIAVSLGAANAGTMTLTSSRTSPTDTTSVFGLSGVNTQLTGTAVTDATTPASMLVTSGQTLNVNVGGTIRKYVFDTDNSQPSIPGTIEIDASGNVADMLAKIQTDLRTSGGPGAASAKVAIVAGTVNVTFDNNYTLPVTLTGNALGLAGATKIPEPGHVDGILASDVEQFTKDSITGGSTTIYSKTGEPVNVQLRWAKTSNETGAETWSLFYASDSRPGAAQPWTRVADYSFDQGILNGITANGAVATAVGQEQVKFNNLQINGASLGEVAINHGAKGITQFADNSGSATTDISSDGYGAGEFISVGVSDQGRVVASYTNGETREIAQIVIATFNAPDQLKRGDGGTYEATSASGQANLRQDGDGIVGSSLEASNTDISEEFTKLIVTQQAYSANTRIVSAANDMLQETLNMIR